MVYQTNKQDQIKSNLFEDTITGVKQDFKAGKPALTEALNTIKNETKQDKIQKLNELYGPYSAAKTTQKLKSSPHAHHIPRKRQVIIMTTFLL